MIFLRERIRGERHVVVLVPLESADLPRRRQAADTVRAFKHRDLGSRLRKSQGQRHAEESGTDDSDVFGHFRDLHHRENSKLKNALISERQPAGVLGDLRDLCGQITF